MSKKYLCNKAEHPKFLNCKSLAGFLAFYVTALCYIFTQQIRIVNFYKKYKILKLVSVDTTPVIGTNPIKILTPYTNLQTCLKAQKQWAYINFCWS